VSCGRRPRPQADALSWVVQGGERLLDIGSTVTRGFANCLGRKARLKSEGAGDRSGVDGPEGEERRSETDVKERNEEGGTGADSGDAPVDRRRGNARSGVPGSPQSVHSPGQRPHGLAGTMPAMVIGGGVLLIGLIALVVFVLRAIFSKDD
jgi:hypothetical protein